MKRKGDLQREYELACDMVWRVQPGGLQHAFWIGYRDALHMMLDPRRPLLCDILHVARADHEPAGN